jgi:antitoxin component YwqK of YwqJK toxin-antitoxin module
MKKSFLLIFFISTLSTVFTQIRQIEKSKCYENGNKQRKYTEWECGKTPGVVDCNEKIDFDERTKTFLSMTGGKPYTGTCETCYENGIRERKITFVNGKEHGMDTTKYMSGCPMVVRNHINGFENGTWTYYFDTTNTLAWEMNFLLGQKHGKHVYFNRQGDTVLLEYYKNDILNGVKRAFYSNGKIHRHITYTNGIQNGPFYSFNREGKLLEKLNYSLGKKDGTFTYYFDDGTLLKTESWSKDVKNGSFTTYYYQGFVQSLENYKKGIKEGWFEEYFPNKRMKLRSLYKKGILIEEHEFNEKGKEIRTFPEVVKEKESEDDDIDQEIDPKAKKKKKKKE